MANPSRVIPRDELLAQVWGYAGTVLSRASDNTVRRLREKIERDPAHPDHLLTVHGVGYRFEPASTPGAGLVGRAELVSEIGARLAPGRWVLLLGPGGVGKTALARACAPDAVWVDLGGVTTVDRAAAAAAAALGIELGADDPVTRVGRALAKRTGRLVLDDAGPLGAHLIEQWRGPGIVGLCTSRIRFDAPGMWVVDVGPLSRDAAISLFVDRARAASVQAVDDRATIGEIVDRTDGLPLAIELAAARSGTLGLADLRDRLPLAGSLFRIVDQAVRALPDAVQAALATLAPLRDGFTLDDAEVMLGVDALEVVELLRDHSLVRRVERTGHTARFTAWEAVREVLQSVPPDPEAVRRRCARLGRWADVLDTLEWDADGVALLTAQLGDVTRAVDDAIANHDPENAARCASVVAWVTSERGPAHAGLATTDAALAAGPTGLARARLRHRRVGVLIALGQWDAARTELRLAVADAARADASELEGRLWYTDAELAYRTGQGGRASASRAAECGRRAGRAGGWVECAEAVAARCAGRRDEEEDLLRQARVRAIEANDRDLLRRTQILLAACARDDGRFGEAARLYEDALDRSSGTPFRRTAAVVTNQLLFLKTGVGDWPESYRWAGRAVSLGRELGATDIEALGLALRANAERWLGRLDAADRTLDEVELLLGGPSTVEAGAMVSLFRGHLARDRGDAEAAIAHAERAEARYAAMGHQGGVELARIDQALGWLAAGDVARARAVERPDRWGRGMATSHLGARALLGDEDADLEPLRHELRRAGRTPPDDDAELLGSVFGPWATRTWRARA